MAAALRARSTTLLASQYTTAQSALVSGAAPDAQFQSFIFHGDFLDARSSAVFAAFFFVGIYAMSALRAVAPKLTLMSIFSMIVLVSGRYACPLRASCAKACSPCCPLDHHVHLWSSFPFGSVHYCNPIFDPYWILCCYRACFNHPHLPSDCKPHGHVSRLI